ncbi:MAG: hypothetical protein WAV76_02215 [Bacteroidota bacterium]
MKDAEILFSVNVGWVQAEAKQRINRRLTDSELLLVKDGLEEGLGFDIETVFETAIDDAVRLAKD